MLDDATSGSVSMSGVRLVPPGTNVARGSTARMGTAIGGGSGSAQKVAAAHPTFKSKPATANMLYRRLCYF